MSDAKTPTVSIIAPLHDQMCQGSKIHSNDPPVVKDIKNAVATDLQKRYGGKEENAFLCMATALDPRFKALPFLDEKQQQDTFARMAGEAARMYEVRWKKKSTTFILLLATINYILA